MGIRPMALDDPRRNPRGDWDNPPLEKQCAKCGEMKSWGEFSDDRRKDGIIRKRSYCKACRNLLSKDYKHTHPGAACAASRKTHLKKDYGLTPEIYELLLLEQGGGCAICGSRVSSRTRNERLAVDHDSGTGKVRGLLCGSCNRALGGFRHIPKLLRKAARYLERSPAALMAQAAEQARAERRR